MNRRLSVLVAAVLLAGCAAAPPTPAPSAEVSQLPQPSASATSVGPSLPAPVSPTVSASPSPALTGTILFARVDGTSSVGHLFLTDSSGGTHSISEPDATCCVVLAPDGSAILMPASATGNRIAPALVAPDGTGYRVLPVGDPTLSLGPGAWSSDASRIALEGWDDQHAGREGLYTERVDGTDRHRVTTAPGGLHDIPVAWSPDGTRLLFTRGGATAERGALFVVDSDGTDLRQLSPKSGSVSTDFWTGPPASWAPDGHAVAFAAFATPTGKDGRTAIYVADIASASVAMIASATLWSTTANWSPGGKSIVFDKRAPTSSNNILFLIHPDGSGLVPVPGGDVGVCCAVWSPDGRQLLYAKGGDARQLIVANVDGSGSSVLAKDLAEWAWYGWVR